MPCPHPPKFPNQLIQRRTLYSVLSIGNNMRLFNYFVNTYFCNGQLEFVIYCLRLFILLPTNVKFLRYTTR